MTWHLFYPCEEVALAAAAVALRSLGMEAVEQIQTVASVPAVLALVPPESLHTPVSVACVQPPVDCLEPLPVSSIAGGYSYGWAPAIVYWGRWHQGGRRGKGFVLGAI